MNQNIKTGRAIVIKEYKTAYPNPIKTSLNEQLKVDRTRSDFPGWTWVTVNSGLSGWMPTSYLKFSNNDKIAISLCEYDATELTVKKNTICEVITVEAGWARVRTEPGIIGWLPCDHLKMI